MKNGKPKVAIVHDWLVAYAGADRVVDCMHHVFPDAPIYTLVYDENNMPAWFKNYDIRTTYLQKLPFATKLYRAMLPWMPRAFEALDLSEYDMVISSCSSCSKGVITGRTLCISATAIRPPAMSGIFIIPTATMPTRWCGRSCQARCSSCASGISAPRTGWTILSPTRIILPGASKNITGATVM